MGGSLKICIKETINFLIFQKVFFLIFSFLCQFSLYSFFFSLPQQDLKIHRWRLAFYFSCGCFSPNWSVIYMHCRTFKFCSQCFQEKSAWCTDSTSVWHFKHRIHIKRQQLGQHVKIDTNRIHR